MPTALITGASQGIGEEFARLFAKDYYDLILVARSRDKLEKLSAGLRADRGIQIRLLVKDLTEPNAPHQIFQELKQASIAVDILVNNAGFGVHGFFRETDWEREAQMIEINIRALTHLTKLFLPGMVERKKGRILNVASTAAFQPGPLMAVYYASKAYVLSYSEALQNELAGTGVTCSVLCPGPTRSGFQEASGQSGNLLLFKLTFMEAAAAAHAGYKGLMKGNTVIVPGLMNKFLAFMTRFSPRCLAPWIVRKMQEK